MSKSGRSLRPSFVPVKVDVSTTAAIFVAKQATPDEIGEYHRRPMSTYRSRRVPVPDTQKQAAWVKRFSESRAYSRT
jgi:hypothetical protein